MQTQVQQTQVQQTQAHQLPLSRMQAEVTQLLNAWGDLPAVRPAPAPCRAVTNRAVSCFDPDEETKSFVTDQPKPRPSGLSVLLPPAPAAPRLAPGPFRCAGELRPGRFVYLYHRPDPSAPGGFQEEPSYRLHVRGDQPLSCTCPDRSLTHRAEARYECKHMRALARQLAPVVPAAWLRGPGTDPFDNDVVIWKMASKAGKGAA